MNIEWQLFTKTTSEESINKLLGIVSDKLETPISESSVELEESGHYAITLSTPISENNWSNAVVKPWLLARKSVECGIYPKTSKMKLMPSQTNHQFPA
jgi:hypothetical protein